MNICNPSLLHLNPSDDDYCRAIVTIPFGSGHEPQEWPGLAHLLEHALFLGSHALFLGRYALAEGFSKASSGSISELAAGELQGLMAQQGIRINASTRLEQSCYMIECLPDQLEEAFTRLCQLIYAPIFSAEQVISEISIIDGEYQAYCEHPAQQLLNLMQTQAHPEHSFYRFLAGNRASLGHDDPELLKQLNLCFQQGYLQQAASLYIEHPEGSGFEPQSKVLYEQLEAIRQHAIRNHSELSKQSLTPNPQALADPDKPASPPLFCGQQTFLAVTDQPVIQWVWPVSNPSINELLLTFGTLDQLAKALQIPGKYSLSLAMQWQQQAALLVETSIPESADTLDKIQVHALEQLERFQKSLQQGGDALIAEMNKVAWFTDSPSSQSKRPALLRATETAIQHHYYATGLFGSLHYQSAPGQGDSENAKAALKTADGINAGKTSERICNLSEALTKPPAVTLISHPGLHRLPLAYQVSDHFPTPYLPANSLKKLQTADAESDLYTQKLPYPESSGLMPFRVVIQKLADTGLTGEQHQICLTHSSANNHAALIWRDLESLKSEDSDTAVCADQLCRELYPRFYRTLRIEQRLGYIVQVMPFTLGGGGNTSDAKPGLVFLIQSASKTSDQLLTALKSELGDLYLVKGFSNS